MDKKGQNILDKLLGKNQKDETDPMKEKNAEKDVMKNGIEQIDGSFATFDDFVNKATGEAITAAHDAIKPFPIPKKMLENIKNSVRPVMKKYLVEAFHMGSEEKPNAS